MIWNMIKVIWVIGVVAFMWKNALDILETSCSTKQFLLILVQCFCWPFTLGWILYKKKTKEVV